MNRRSALLAVGTGASCLSAGCLSGLPTLSEPDMPRLSGIRALNWHTEPQVLNVRIETDTDVLYDKAVQLPGGNPTEYYTPGRDLEDHPSELPPSVLYTWTDAGSRERAAEFDFGDTSYDDCVGLELDICPECAKQKGETELSLPASPDVRILSTSDCTFPE